MRKLLTWIVRIIVLLLLLQVALWSWDRYRQGAGNAGQKEVLDGDKICRITNPDLGSCVCLHRQTNERLKLPYEECVERARNQYP